MTEVLRWHSVSSSDVVVSRQ